MWSLAHQLVRVHILLRLYVNAQSSSFLEKETYRPLSEILKSGEVPNHLKKRIEQWKSKNFKGKSLAAVGGSKEQMGSDDSSPLDWTTQQEVSKKTMDVSTFVNEAIPNTREALADTKISGIHTAKKIANLTQKMVKLDDGAHQLAAVRNEAAKDFVAETKEFENFRVGAVKGAISEVDRIRKKDSEAQNSALLAAESALTNAKQWIEAKRHVSDLGQVSSILQEMFPGKTPAQVWETVDINQDSMLTVDEVFQALYNLGNNRLSEKHARDVAEDTYAHLGNLMGSSKEQQTRSVFLHAFASNSDGSVWLAPHKTQEEGPAENDLAGSLASFLGTSGQSQANIGAQKQERIAETNDKRSLKSTTI